MPATPGWTIKLDDGLVMRGAVPEDVDRLSDYNAEMHREPVPDIPAFWIGEWTRDLFLKPHPRMTMDDIIIVEDSATGEIVSSTVYFDQVWSYCGIPVPVGRPEIVSTHPGYRNRGLVRTQFELMERWGDERGHLIQGITGIPYYYRQFGYEMALDMPMARKCGIENAPRWKDDERRVVSLRPLLREDLPFVHTMRRPVIERNLFAPDVSQEELGYQLFNRNDRSALSMSPIIIEDAAGKPNGFMAIKSVLPQEQTQVYAMEFTESGMFGKFTEPTLEAMHALVSELSSDDGKRIKTILFELPEGHPVHPFLGRNFVASGRRYAWYVRVPKLVELLTLIGPKLEQRLVGTQFDGLTGEKLISFYRTGVKLKFEDGQLSSVSNEVMPDRAKAAANFPDLTFLHLLFGRKSLAELGAVFVDVYSNSDADIALLDTLFPKMPSDLMFALS